MKINADSAALTGFCGRCWDVMWSRARSRKDAAWWSTKSPRSAKRLRKVIHRHLTTERQTLSVRHVYATQAAVSISRHRVEPNSQVDDLRHTKKPGFIGSFAACSHAKINIATFLSATSRARRHPLSRSTVRCRGSARQVPALPR